jgi:hypothetical protein
MSKCSKLSTLVMRSWYILPKGFARRVARPPTGEGRSSARTGLIFQRTDEPLSPKRGIGSNNVFAVVVLCRARHG